MDETLYPLMPLQQSHLALPRPEAYFFPVFCYEVHSSIATDVLCDVFRALVRQRDALRVRFTRTAAGDWRQSFPSECVPDEELISHFDLSSLPVDQQDAAIPKLVISVAKRTQLERGGLSRMVLISRGDGRPRVMALLVHHTVLDGLSMWRVDAALSEALAGWRSDDPIRFPVVTSTEHCARAFSMLSEDEAHLRSVVSWRNELVRQEPALPSASEHPPLAGSVSLNEGDTELLRRRLPTAHRAPMDVLLPVIAGQALSRWLGSAQVAFSWLHHGRAPALAGLDLWQALGLLARPVPLSLAIEPQARPTDAVAALRQQCPDLGARGLQYCALAHYGHDADLRNLLRTHPAHQIQVNYQGDMDFYIKPRHRKVLTHLYRVGVGHPANIVLSPVYISFRFTEHRFFCDVRTAGFGREQTTRLAEALLGTLRSFLS